MHAAQSQSHAPALRPRAPATPAVFGSSAPRKCVPRVRIAEPYVPPGCDGPDAAQRFADKALQRPQWRTQPSNDSGSE